MRPWALTVLCFTGCTFDDGRLAELCDGHEDCWPGASCERGICRDWGMDVGWGPVTPMPDAATSPSRADRPLPDPTRDATAPRPGDTNRPPPPRDAEPPDRPRPDASTANACPAETICRPPLHDVYVDSAGFSPSSGQFPVLEVSRDDIGERRAYLQFPLGRLTDDRTIRRAHVSLFVIQSNVVGSSLLSIRRASTAWTEDDLSWNTQPTTGAAIDHHEGATAVRRRLRLDVTEIVNEALASGAGLVGFGLDVTHEARGVAHWLFSSRDQIRPPEGENSESPWLEVVP